MHWKSKYILSHGYFLNYQQLRLSFEDLISNYLETSCIDPLIQKTKTITETLSLIICLFFTKFSGNLWLYTCKSAKFCSSFYGFAVMIDLVASGVDPVVCYCLA